MTTVAAASTVIRAAGLPDVPAIVALGTRFIDETTYAGHFAANPAQMAALLEQLIDSPHGHVVVAERDDAIIGMMGMLAYAHHISGAWIAGEIFLWVNPEARGTIGIRLLRAFEQWARAHGATALQVSAPASSPRVAELYTRLGFDVVETIFQRRLS